MTLIVELKVNAAMLWMLLVSLTTKQNIVVIGCACCIGASTHPVIET